MAVLADLDAATGADLASFDDAELKALASKAQTGRKVVAGLLTRIAGEARRREATGSSAPSDEVADPDGDRSAAGRKADADRAKLPERLPAAGEAAADGTAKVENADYLAHRTRVLSPTESDRLRDHDAEIARQLTHAGPDAFELWLERLLIHIADCDDDLSAAEKAIAASAFKLFRRPDGTWVLAGQLDDERGMVVKDIIERRAAQIARQRPPGQRSVTDNDRAAALVDLVTRRTGGAGGSGPALALPEPSAGSGVEVLQWPGGPSGDGGATPCCADDLAAPVRMGVGVIVDAQTLLHGPHADSVAENWRGDPLDPAVASRLACDTDVYAIVFDQFGLPTGVGLTCRSATRAQRLVLRALYPTCPIDGVTPFAACDIHHVNVAFSDGGETELDNLVPISKPWHHRIHDQGWILTMDADRTLHLRRPDKTLERTIPPPQPITRHGP